MNKIDRPGNLHRLLQIRSRPLTRRRNLWLSTYLGASTGYLAIIGPPCPVSFRPGGLEPNLPKRWLYKLNYL